MATPTDQQQIRATLRRMARDGSQFHHAVRVIRNTVEFIGHENVARAIARIDAEASANGQPTLASTSELPPLMGAAEAADVLGMKATNLKRLSPPLPVAAVISGRIPVYRQADVMAAKERRDARRAAREGDGS